MFQRNFETLNFYVLFLVDISNVFDTINLGDNLDESTLLKIQEVELIIKEKISVLLGHYYPSNIKLYFNEMNSTT